MSKQSKSQQDFGGLIPSAPKICLPAFKSAPWPRTRERLKIIRKNLDKSDAEIGRIFGVTRAAIHDLRRRFGIAKRRANTQRKEVIIGLVRDMQPGLTPQDMALKLKLTERQAVYYGNLAGYRFASRKERTKRYWNEQFKSLPPALTIQMVARQMEICYNHAFYLCKKFRHKVRDARRSKLLLRVPGRH